MVLTQQLVKPTPAQTARRRYVADAVTTTSPAGLVTMLYDGLVSDLERAKAAIEQGDHRAANDRLVRAQRIVLELQTGLRPELWSGGPALARLYLYFGEQLVKAKLTNDAALVGDLHRLVVPLRDAWHQAAIMVRASS
jgi:flagellar protein FliS